MATPSDKAIEEAATEVDASISTSSATDDKATSTTTTTTKDEEDEPKSVSKMLRLFKKHSDGTNVMKESIKTFSNPDGSDKKGDLIVNSVEEGLIKIKELIEYDKASNAKKPKKIKKWEFRTSPHELFDKTLDDTFTVFVTWAKMKKDDDDEKKDATEEGYNVSKAFRRLVSYADWMEDTGDDLIEPKLTSESCKVALDAWAMKCSISSNPDSSIGEGTFCWWIDLAAIEVPKIKKEIPPKDSLRAFVWYAHYIMYDPNAQKNGIVFIENCAKVGFIEGCTMIPMKLGVKLDRLTIGVLPIRMTQFILLETPKWMDLFMKFMGMFMSKKMLSRMVNIKDDWDQIEKIVGKDSIPKGYGGKLEGSMEVDPVEAKYFS